MLLLLLACGAAATCVDTAALALVCDNDEQCRSAYYAETDTPNRDGFHYLASRWMHPEDFCSETPSDELWLARLRLSAVEGRRAKCAHDERYVFDATEMEGECVCAAQIGGCARAYANNRSALTLPSVALGVIACAAVITTAVRIWVDVVRGMAFRRLYRRLGTVKGAELYSKSRRSWTE